MTPTLILVCPTPATLMLPLAHLGRVGYFVVTLVLSGAGVVGCTNVFLLPNLYFFSLSLVLCSWSRILH